MTGDCYAILGVHPAAEDVVIGAAYRALMRHYHPDTNPDPTAQVRAREITAAYALLRDPAKRAEYDAQRMAGDDLWLDDEPPAPAPPPAMRAAGIAAALLALALVGAAWMRPQAEPSPSRSTAAAVPKPADAEHPSASAPLAELGPEHERLAALREEIAPPEPPMPIAEVPAPIVEAVDPPIPVKLARAAPVRPRPQPKRVAAAPSRTASSTKPQRPTSDRVATLDRLSSGFFSQSMVHATAAKKEQLLSMRDRLAAERGACRSEACVAGTYVRQMRETSAIMEGRAETAK